MAQTILQRLRVGGLDLSIARPPDFEELLTEAAFDDERLLPYWAHLWDSGLLLAEAVQRVVRPGMRVLELGCGLALPSIVAARAGARVTATDWSGEAVTAALANAQRNGVELEAEVVDWRLPEALVAAAPWDLVLAADVVYEAKQGPLLAKLLPRLGPLVLLAEPGRAVAEPFFAAIEDAWDVEPIQRREQPRVTVHRLSARAAGEPAS